MHFLQLRIKCGVAKSCPGTHTALLAPMFEVLVELKHAMVLYPFLKGWSYKSHMLGYAWHLYTRPPPRKHKQNHLRKRDLSNLHMCCLGNPHVVTNKYYSCASRSTMYISSLLYVPPKRHNNSYFELALYTNYSRFGFGVRGKVWTHHSS